MDQITLEEKKNWLEILQEIRKSESVIIQQHTTTKEEVKQFQQYLVDYKGEIDPHEMFTNQRILNQQQISEKINFAQLDKLQKIIQNPYFSRVDFIFSGEQQAEIIYIGAQSFMNMQNEIVIYDWRAPIASIFYDFDLGKASFKTPNGLSEGYINKKRQIKFFKGCLEYAVEVEMTIFDQALQNELANQTGGKMSTIIGTIQKEQSLIIRDQKIQSQVIQGAAGSGKTSIALHKIAFLLYHFRERLGPENILILSPNHVYSNFISQVLPELGESPVKELTIDEFIQKETKIQSFETRISEAESLMNTSNLRLSYLNSKKVVQDIQIYLDSLEQSILSPKDIIIDEYHYDKSFILTRFHGYRKQSILERIRLIADDILEDLRKRPFQPSKRPTAGKLRKLLKDMLIVKSPECLYQNFLESKGFKKVRTRSFSDLFALGYFQYFYQGMSNYTEIKYLIIDEMQDYSWLQLSFIRQVIACPILLVGDQNQILTPTAELTLENLSNLLGGAPIVQLNRSYRSTFEIMSYAKNLIGDQKIEPVLRHGQQPVEIEVATMQDELTVILELIKKKSKNVLITKTKQEAYLLQENLKRKNVDVPVLAEDTKDFTEEKTIICPMVLAKGLEFDRVIVINAGDENYSGKLGKHQLFVIATRALHELYLIRRKALYEQK
ncbi:HelD family protein [Enterococcus alishanensis]|uniref:HelD family protein n=1 Tax=Enterococcus alishanensis TaxID=1303817 RepID=UPI0031B802A0